MTKINCHQYKKLALAAMLFYQSLYAYAQTDAEKATERMINASRTGASPLFFQADTLQALVTVNQFDHSTETNVRGGLPNFFSKLKSGKTVTVGYIGGSITQAVNGYRLQSANYIQSLFPGKKVRFLNAGVSGTGTDLAACRLKEQLLIHQPDLVFIEFAVNGAYQEGLEGMIRQIIQNNPQTDICLIYSLLNGQTKIYTEGQIPENIKGFEKVADHYQLPSVHLGMEAASLEKNNQLTWKGNLTTDNKIVFSTDGIHPLQKGGDLYAAAIVRGFNKMKEAPAGTVLHILPDALFADNWENAKMLDPLETVTFSKGWKKIVTDENGSLKQFSNWFGYLMRTEKPGASFTFRFKGSMFGFYDLGGPEVGQVTIEVDGNPVSLQEINTKGFHYYKAAHEEGNRLINRFNIFCNNRYRGQYEFIETDPGEHIVKVTLSKIKSDKAKILSPDQQQDISTHPEKYDRTALYIGKILVKGEVLK